MSVDEFKKKIKTLILLRLLFVTLLFGSIFFLDIRLKQFYTTNAIYLFLFLFYAPSLTYIIIFKRVPDTLASQRLFAYLQLVIDVLSIVVLVILTGGIESWFSFLLILVTIAGSIVLGRRGGYLLATLGGILYGAVIDLQFYRVIPVAFNPNLQVRDFFYNIFINITGLYLTAYLMGYLVSRLEKTAESLQEKDVDLRELSRFHLEVIENVPSGLFTLDSSGRIRLFNRAAERITGLRREQVFYHPIDEVFPFLSIPPEMGRHHGEIMRDDETRHIGMNISVNRSSTGEVLGYIGTFQDLTLIIKMEEEIKQKEKLAAIGELSASIAHELRNPIASMRGSFEMLKEDRLPPETKRRLMDMAISEMDRLDNIVTDFLLFCNPRPPVMKRFDLSVVVSEVAEMLDNTADNVRIERDVQEGIEIVADEQKIRQLLWNLATNAVEAVGEGGEVRLSVYTDDESVILKVSDSGEGIARKNLEKIFYPFFSTKKGGTGLGLSIAYRIVEEHGGNIGVLSEEGKGTEFSVTIPLRGDRRQPNGRERVGS